MSERKKDAAAGGTRSKKGKDNEAKAQKNEDAATGEDLSTRVSSVNDWEHADLGDDSRKNKFLRLMGAAKCGGKEKPAEQKPARKFVTDAQKVQEELEEQFKEGLEHTLVSGHKGHVGLGFHAETPTVAPTEPKPRQNKVTKFDDDDAAVVGLPNNDIAGPNRAEEYSDDESGTNGSGEGVAAADDEVAGKKRSEKHSKKHRKRRDDDGSVKLEVEAPTPECKKSKRTTAAVSAEASRDADSASKTKRKARADATSKPVRSPTGFVKAADS